MKKITTPYADVYNSEKCFRVNKEIFTEGKNAMKELGEEYTYWVESTFKYPEMKKLKEFIDLYGRKRNLERIAILDAHGGTDGNWVYKDNEKFKNVQDWINSKQNKYAGLLLNVCNPGGHTPKTKNSAIILPYIELEKKGSLVNLFTNFWGFSFNIILPNKEVDSYSFESDLKDLRGKSS